MKKINNINDTLFEGIVSHTRYKPFTHSFAYRFCYFWFSLNFKHKYKFFKKNRFTLFSFYDKDHGEVGKKSGNTYQLLKKKFLKEGKKNIYDIKSFCLPRILGYVFNPITVFVGFDDKNKATAIIYEVSNTFNERHSYYCEINKQNNVKKRFHVSPFFNINGHYVITFNIDRSFVNLFINYKINNQKIFEASFRGKSVAMNDKNLLGIFFSNIFQNFKVTIAIHLEALKLFVKGATYIKKPKKPKNFFSEG